MPTTKLKWPHHIFHNVHFPAAMIYVCFGNLAAKTTTKISFKLAICNGLRNNRELAKEWEWKIILHFVNKLGFWTDCWKRKRENAAYIILHSIILANDDYWWSTTTTASVASSKYPTTMSESSHPIRVWSSPREFVCARLFSLHRIFGRYFQMAISFSISFCLVLVLVLVFVWIP